MEESQSLEGIQWVMGGALIALGLWISSFSILRMAKNSRRRKVGDSRHVSGLPFAGPLFFLLGYRVLPVDFSMLAFLIFLIDWDTSLLLIFVPIAFAKQLFSRKESSGNKD
ncbi:MAG: hypothetical protein AAGB46_03370 [Verrucomicrobiota bacterium]